MNLGRMLEKARKEKELIGIYLTSHPLDSYKLEIKAICTPLESLSSDLSSYKDRDVTIAGIIVAMREGRRRKGMILVF